VTGAAGVEARRQVLSDALRRVLSERDRHWLVEAIATIGADPTQIMRIFPAAGRSLPRRVVIEEPLTAWAWTTDEAARALILAALPTAGRDDVLRELYRYGDRHERSAVLRALDVLPAGPVTQELVPDALRTNDPRLVAAALSVTGLAVLDERELVQAVLKCVFMDLDLARLPLPDERITPKLSRALAGYALERVTAGRSVPDALWPLVERHPPHDMLAALRRVHSRPDPVEEPAE
jgi:hypothetical protein